MTKDSTSHSPNRRPWWATSIVKVARNKLLIRGYNIEDLIGNVSYPEILYLEVMGELPSKGIGKLLEAVLVASCDYGLVSPAIASARMAVTCGISFNSAIANGINVLGDIHGGATEEGMRLYYDIARRAEAGEGAVPRLVESVCTQFRETHHFMPGFGHPVNDKCPRVRRLMELGEASVHTGEISGKYIEIAQTFESTLERVYGRTIPMNVDGAIAALQCEMGLPTEIAKGLFSLSRGIGILAHAYEELTTGSRLKAPCPPEILQQEFVYIGAPERELPKRDG